MLYIFREDDEIIGAVDGPEIDMLAAFQAWEVENINAGPRPVGLGLQEQHELRSWYATRKGLIEKLHEKYGSIPQQGLTGLWMKVVVKDLKYVARKEFADVTVYPKGVV